MRENNQAGENGHTPLTEALEQRNFEAIETLLASDDIDINTGGTYIPVSRTVNNIWPPFLLAVHTGDKEIIQAFLTHPKINVTQQNQDIKTALIIAAQASNVEAFKLLVSHFQANWRNIFQNDIESYREYVNCQDSHYHSALYYATDNYLTGYTDNPAIIQALLEWQDNQQEHLISRPEQQMFTTMVLQSLGVVSYMLEAADKRNEENEGYEQYGLTEAYVENENNLYIVLEKFHILREIIDFASNSSTVQHNFKINFAYLLDINERDQNGNTLLINAILTEDINTVKCLLKFPEIELNKTTSRPTVRGLQEDNPPFLLAVIMGDVKIIQEFLSHPKTDITQKNQDNETALILAAQTPNVGAFQLLVSHFQANWQDIFENDIEQFREYINWQDCNYHSALSYATDHYLIGATDDPAIIQALLEWQDSQQALLISGSEQQEFLMQLLEQDEGYVSIEDPESQKENLSNVHRLSTLRKIAEENLGAFSTNPIVQKAMNQVPAKDLRDIERVVKEIVEYTLRGTPYEEWKIKDIGESDDSTAFG